jgi:hypothetical protein
LDDFISQDNWLGVWMNIGSGLYGPATNVTPNGEKHWPPLNERARTEYMDKLWLDECSAERMFLSWLTKCKHYTAEYYED